MSNGQLYLRLLIIVWCVVKRSAFFKQNAITCRCLIIPSSELLNKYWWLYKIFSRITGLFSSKLAHNILGLKEFSICSYSRVGRKTTNKLTNKHKQCTMYNFQLLYIILYVINDNICFSTVIKPTFLDNVICSESLNITNFFIN